MSRWSENPRRQQLASSTARGYGVEHRRLRAYILRRDPWCRGFPEGIHGDELVPSTVMDHVVSLRRGGSTTPVNCVGSCRACNTRKAVMVEGAGYTNRRGSGGAVASPARAVRLLNRWAAMERRWKVI